MRKDDCIFCKIAAGEIPSATVYEDEFFRAILDISPATKGHIIILPKNHADNLYELEEAEASRIMSVAAKIAKAMKEELQCEGLNLLQNNGTIAGQTVFHFHVHLIPRFKEDHVTITWHHGSYTEEEKKNLADAIQTKIQ